MLTSNDIKKITGAQIEAQKEIFFTKEEMDEKFYSKAEMDERFKNLQTSVDAAYKDKKAKDQEMVVMNHRLKKTEKILDQVAPKLGLKYEH